MISLAIAYVTGRKNCRFDWLFSSLALQNTKRITQIIVVDFYAQEHHDIGWTRENVNERKNDLFGQAEKYGFVKFLTHAPVRPNIWQGPHRIMRENWWAASAARNTAMAHCRADWIAFLDDRCVLTGGWMPAIKRAIQHNYIAFGSYEKHHNLAVRNGTPLGNLEVTRTASDNREAICGGGIVKAEGHWCYGCTLALPLKWALKVNGFSEDYADGCSMEDILFGMTLQNSGFPMRYDPSMKIIEDRTPSECTEKYRREDKGVSPNDKSHKLLEVFANAKTSMNSYSLSAVRNDVLSGKPFPLPSASHIDWYDQKPHADWDTTPLAPASIPV
jgi:glycosyltransferase involved in cell wall biosynthesis